MLEILDITLQSKYFWIVTIFVSTYIYLKYLIYGYWKKRGVPYATPSMPFSNVLQVALGKISLGNHLKENYGKLKKHRFSGIYMFHKPVLMINDPELIRHVLVKDFNKFRDRGIYHNEQIDPLTANLFFLPGEKWRKLRAKLTPTFTTSKLKEMFPLIKEISDNLVNTCDALLAKSDIIEIKDLISRYTTDSISSIAYGYNGKSLNNQDDEFKRYGSMAFDMSPIITTLGLFAPAILDYLRIPVLSKEMTRFFSTTFQDIVKCRRQNSIVRKDFLNLLMQLMDEGTLDSEKKTDAEDKLTMEEAQAQAYIFFLGGFETSSSTMTYLLYELALNTEIQNKVHVEIDEFLAKGELTYSRIKNELPYLDMVFSETLRKHPTFPFLSRICIEDWKIPDSNVEVEKGTAIIIPVIGLHHDPNVYPNPEKFDPARFSEENIATRSPYVYLPFGDGPRICIGSRFAVLQSKLALLAFLAKYKLHACEKTVVPINYSVRSITQTPDGGVYLRIEKRRCIK